ncbi:MAG: RDD family protein [Pseudomonadota bacterium]
MDDRYQGLPDPETHDAFYADLPTKRLLAWVVDSLAIALLTLLLLPLTLFTAFFFLPFFWLLVGLAYRIVTLTNRSATPGMRMMSVEIRQGDGSALDLGTATVHTILYALFSGFFLIQLVSIVLMLTTERRQGLPDMILGTSAINLSASY